jgi:hypothetical protein
MVRPGRVHCYSKKFFATVVPADQRLDSHQVKVISDVCARDLKS